LPVAEFTLVLSPRAQADLHEIMVYSLKAWGADQTIRYMSMMERALVDLPQTAFRGRRRDDIRAGYRSLSIGKHIIFYQIDNSAIHVFGILHSRMDAGQLG